MKGVRPPVGYTIIEVLIVLAISGVMFLIAVQFVSGKVESNTFRQGINELASSLQSTITEVTNGQYSDIPLVCKYVGGKLNITNGAGSTGTNSTSNDTQGQNPECVYIGKVLHFGENDLLGHPFTQQYETFSIAGLRIDTNGNPITMDTATGTPFDNDFPQVIPQLTTQSTMPQHLDVGNMGIEPTAANPSPPIVHSYGLGLIQSLGSTTQAGATQVGYGPIGLYYIQGLLANTSSTVAPNDINGGTITPVPQGNEFVICVTDQKQYGYIVIGDVNNQLEAKAVYSGATTCG